MLRTGDGDPVTPGTSRLWICADSGQGHHLQKEGDPGCLGVEVPPALRFTGFSFCSEGCFIFGSHLCK